MQQSPYYSWFSWGLFNAIDIILKIYRFFLFLIRIYSMQDWTDTMRHGVVFSIWKSLWWLQKTCMKIEVRAIYTYKFFSYMYTLLLCWNIKSCFNCCFNCSFKLDHRPLFTTHRLSYTLCQLKSAMFQSLLFSKSVFHWQFLIA